MSRYQPYPNYKESGVEWLGEVPKHWDVFPCRSFVDEQTTKNDNGSNENYLSLMANIGIIPYAEKGDVGNKKPDDLSKCKLVKKGDFVINSMNYGIGSYGLSELDGICSPVYIVLRPRLNHIASRFAFRIFENRPFQTYAQSFGNGILAHRSAINWDILKGINVGLPPMDEQNKILAFLDIQTDKIDTLIAKQEQMIKLLNEKRSSLISHAVTKGLTSNVQMKDSGVEWLGEVPEHWHPMQIRRILPIMEQGKSPECDNRVAEFDEWGVLKTSCVNNGLYNSEANKALPSTAQPFPQYEVNEGDILMSRASGSVNLIGSVAYVHKTRAKILMSDKIFRLYLDSRVNKIFFIYLMSSSYIRANIERAISGGEGMANNITKGAINSFIFALPPLSEQEYITDYLDTQTSKIDTLIAKARQAIGLMKERRTALISAVVTGKIDVRGMA